jgi:GntR family transcriptional repressor for pyruvate dehydrogenase complex
MGDKNAVRPDRETIELPVPRRENLAASVAKLLKRYVLVERLEAGYRLPSERRMADALQVSRPVLREALSQLIGEGILVRHSPRSLRVADFDRVRVGGEVGSVDDADAEMRHLVEVRVVLEIGAIEAIVHRATEAHLAEIERWVIEGERRVAAGESLLAADARFHAALLHAFGNPVIDAFLPVIEEHLRRHLLSVPHHLTGSGTPDDYRVVAEHRQIFEAVKRRDVNAARLVILAHLNGYLQPEQQRARADLDAWAVVEKRRR